MSPHPRPPPLPSRAASSVGGLLRSKQGMLMSLVFAVEGILQRQLLLLLLLQQHLLEPVDLPLGQCSASCGWTSRPSGKWYCNRTPACTSHTLGVFHRPCRNFDKAPRVPSAFPLASPPPSWSPSSAAFGQQRQDPYLASAPQFASAFPLCRLAVLASPRASEPLASCRLACGCTSNLRPDIFYCSRWLFDRCHTSGPAPMPAHNCCNCPH
mmetsp:Transcript_58416/g.123908  ORF Transcript_58416/g.123908 Transcript_58416/m.123908 type:complete len:211 (-) Transcript_58416:87-719(-)